MRFSDAPAVGGPPIETEGPHFKNNECCGAEHSFGVGPVQQKAQRELHNDEALDGLRKPVDRRRDPKENEQSAEDEHPQQHCVTETVCGRHSRRQAETEIEVTDKDTYICDPQQSMKDSSHPVLLQQRRQLLRRIRTIRGGCGAKWQWHRRQRQSGKG